MITAKLSVKQLQDLTESIIKEIRESIQQETDAILSLEQVREKYGWSKVFIYKNAAKLGAMRAGKKLFFSKRNIDFMIRQQVLSDTHTPKGCTNLSANP